MGRGAMILKTKQPRPAAALNVLRFLGSDDSPPNKYCAIQFTNPQSSGLPIWGPSNQGWVAIVERLTRQQTGYFGANPWWCNNGAFMWSGGDPIAGGGASDSYIGPCPYPQDGTSGGTTHWQEMSGIAAGYDNLINRAGSHIVITHNVMRTQGFKVTKNTGDNSKAITLYYSLPSTASANIIDAPDGPNGGSAFSANTITFGETNPPNPVIRFGDSPWTDFGYERFSGDLGRIKVVSIALSEADILSEAADMSRLVTSQGLANIWWGKTNWRTIDDLTCDYGTGRAFAWADITNKATLAALGS